MKRTTDIIVRGKAPGAPAYEPIQTYYHGHHFRSRTEARWAVFYDALGVPWEYEREGYELGRGLRYLPDFWLPDQDCWVEIKGARPTPDEERKGALLSESTQKRVLLFWGAIPRDIGTAGPDYGEIVRSALLYAPGCCDDNQYAWCECPVCGALGIEYEARSDRMRCRRGACKRDGYHDRGHNGDTPLLLRAYQAARHCRFDNSDRPLIGKN